MPKKAFFFQTFPVHRHLGKAVRLSNLPILPHWRLLPIAMILNQFVLFPFPLSESNYKQKRPHPPVKNHCVPRLQKRKMPKKAFFFHTFPVHRHLGKAVRLSGLPILPHLRLLPIAMILNQFVLFPFPLSKSNYKQK